MYGSYGPFEKIVYEKNAYDSMGVADGLGCVDRPVASNGIGAGDHFIGSNCKLMSMKKIIFEPPTNYIEWQMADIDKGVVAIRKPERLKTDKLPEVAWIVAYPNGSWGSFGPDGRSLNCQPTFKELVEEMIMLGWELFQLT